MTQPCLLRRVKMGMIYCCSVVVTNFHCSDLHGVNFIGHCSFTLILIRSSRLLALLSDLQELLKMSPTRLVQ